MVIEIKIVSKPNKPNLKILQTPVRFYPYIGGVENYVYELSKKLSEFGHDVTIVCSNEGYSEVVTNDDETKLQIDIKIDIKRLWYVCKIANTNITPTLPFNLLSNEFDLIHTHLPTPWSSDWSAFASRIKNIPLILTYHNDIVSFGAWKVFSWLYNSLLLDVLLEKSERILISQPRYYNSPYLANYKEKTKILPPGVDTDKFKPLKLEKSENLLFVASLDSYHRYKGLDLLLKALKVVKDLGKDFVLLVVGSGELEEYYRTMAQSLGLGANVDFLGKISEEKLIELYNRCSCLILPSKSYAQEGFGLVALEALSCGTPVIVSEVVGISEDVEKNNCGFTAKPEEKEIAKAIINILEGEDRSMGRKGRRLILKKYSWHAVAREIEKIYFQALEGFESRRGGVK